VAHPRMYDPSNELLDWLRKICLSFPAVVEKEAWGECTFRVAGGKMFAMTDNNHHQSGHVAVWVIAPPTVQETLIRSMPERFFKPPYVGAKGWVGVRLDVKTDWNKLAAILRDGYSISAPAKLSRPKAGAAQSRVRRSRTTGTQSGMRPRKTGPAHRKST
jgi:hypothetical protein